MEETNNTNVLNQPIEIPIVQPAQQTTDNLKSINNPKKINPIIFAGVIFFIIIIGIGAYFLEVKKTQNLKKAEQLIEELKPIRDEQLLRAKDASLANNSAELLNAFERFYAFNDRYPWQKNKDSDKAQFTEINNAKWMEDIFSEQELKPSFRDKLIVPEEKYILYTSGENSSDGLTGQDIYVCFKPKFAGRIEEAKNRCNTDTKIKDTDLCLSNLEQICIP